MFFEDCGQIPIAALLGGEQGLNVPEDPRLKSGVSALRQEKLHYFDVIPLDGKMQGGTVPVRAGGQARIGGHKVLHSL